MTNRVRFTVDDWSHVSTSAGGFFRHASTSYDTHRRVVVDVEGSDEAVAEVARSVAAIARPRLATFELNGFTWCQACRARVVNGVCANLTCQGSRAITS